MTDQHTEVFTKMVDDIARVVHQANKAFCETVGDFSQVDWEQADESTQRAAKSGVTKLAENPNITPQQLHEEWMNERIEDGWVYGETKDADKKTHPCLVPYEELSPPQRFKDHLFGNIVKTYLVFE